MTKAPTLLTDPRLPGSGKIRFWTSLEGENPGGSVKDHLVSQELLSQLASGKLKPGMMVCELSAGSTARSLAHWGAQCGLQVHLFLPDDLDEEKRAQLRDSSARLTYVPRATAESVYQQYLRENPDCWPLNQMGNPLLADHYVSVARSYLSELPSGVDLVMGPIGTGHSLLGMGKGFSPAELWSVEPADFDLPGVRNLERQNFGPSDPCDIQKISHRVFVKSSEFRDWGPLLSSNGPLVASASFHLILSSLGSVRFPPRVQNVWLVGADLRRC